jgi:UDP-2-acetamido-3-amino-2,3-dideoxy-glucuronate N-acetyltransferase
MKSKFSLINTIELIPFGDDRGSLVAVEGGISIPFEIKRVYYLFGTKRDVARGFHAHKNLKQFIVCVSGSCSIVLNDGSTQERILLDRSTIGLLVEGLIWREMHEFSEDCVLLVMASEIYDEEDYVRNYAEFLELKGRFK